ncbi:MAG: hypothetical protein ACXVBJ_04075 [Flavisolibacter sp.]
MDIQKKGGQHHRKRVVSMIGMGGQHAQDYTPKNPALSNYG